MTNSMMPSKEELKKEREEIVKIMKILDMTSLNPMYKAEVATMLYGNNCRMLSPDDLIISKSKYETMYTKEEYDKVYKQILSDLLTNNSGHYSVPTDMIIIPKEEYNRLQLCELKSLEPPTYVSMERVEQEITDKYNQKLKEHYADQHNGLREYERKETTRLLILKLRKFLDSVKTITDEDSKNALYPDIGYSVREVDEFLEEIENSVK